MRSSQYLNSKAHMLFSPQYFSKTSLCLLILHNTLASAAIRIGTSSSAKLQNLFVTSLSSQYIKPHQSGALTTINTHYYTCSVLSMEGSYMGNRLIVTGISIYCRKTSVRTKHQKVRLIPQNIYRKSLIPRGWVG